MNKDFKNHQRFGWSIESESPLVLRHSDGSRASGEAAQSILYLLSERALEDISTHPNYAIWRKGKQDGKPGWMRSGNYNGQGHVALFSEEKAGDFANGLGDDFVVRPVFLKTLPLE